jgi:Putative prokaryotic signal transducing protein
LIDRRTRRALEGYNNRHAGLHICPIRTILQDNNSNNRKCRPTRQGHGRLKSLVPPRARLDKGEIKLRELVRTNDIVLVSAVGALLDGANIHHLVLDQNMSIIEGSLGVLPRRILVHEDDNRQARQLLSDAGLAHELRADD